MHRMTRWLRGHTPVVDLVLILLVAAPALIHPQEGSPQWIQATCLAALLVPLMWRRSHPAVVAAVVVAVAWLGLLGAVWREHLPLGHIALETMVYTLVVRGLRGQAAAAAVGTLGFFTVWTFTWYPGWNAAGYALSVVTAWLLGEYIRARRAYLHEVERRAELADSERHALTRAAVAEERARIARELHDVLAHSVGVMVVNAEGARLMGRIDPAVTDQTLDLIGTTGRTALKELRRVLDVLHDEDPVSTPQPTEVDLRELVARAGAGRAPIRLRISGTSAGVPATAVLQAYRIVQEALTNVVKHAGDRAEVEVTVDFDAPGPRRTVRVEVCDTGADAGRRPVTLPSSGRGLVGMRERVAMFGGTLRAAPTASGGYRVVATLPVGDESRSAASSPVSQPFHSRSPPPWGRVEPTTRTGADL